MIFEAVVDVNTYLIHCKRLSELTIRRAIKIKLKNVSFQISFLLFQLSTVFQTERINSGHISTKLC